MGDDSLSDEELDAKVDQLRAREGVPEGPGEVADAGTVVGAEFVHGDAMELSVLVTGERTVTATLADPAALFDALGLAPGEDPETKRAALAGREVALEREVDGHVVDVAGTTASREGAFGRAYRALPFLGLAAVVGAALVGTRPVTALGWALLGGAWVGLPTAVVADARSLPAWVDWNPSTAWAVGAALYPFGPGVAAAYAVRRDVQTTPPTAEPPRDRWAWLLAAGVVLWGVTLLLGRVGAPDALYVLTMGTAWATVPLAVRFDCEAVARRTAWEPLSQLWVLGAAFWAPGAVVAVAYLLVRRRRAGLA